MKDKIIQSVDDIKYFMIDNIIKIVNINSIEDTPKEGMPFGKGVHDALIETLNLAEDLGFKTCNVDGYMGYAQYGEGEDYIGIVGHLDVVETKDGWITPPFEADIRDNKIYARGILDNKGPILSCLFALYVIKELGIKLKYPVRVIFGTNEETGMKDIPYYLSKEKPPLMGWTPDCKFPVVYGERGRAKLMIEASKDNLEKFFSFISEYFLQASPNGDRLNINYHDEEFGSMQMRGFNLTTKDDKVNFEFVLSYPAITNLDEIMERINLKLDSTMNLVCLHNFDPVKFDKDCELVSKLQKAYEEATNLDGTPVTTTGGTYAKAMPNILPFGPSFPGQKGIAHNPNEWLDIDDLMKFTKIYALSIYYLGSED